MNLREIFGRGWSAAGFGLSLAREKLETGMIFRPTGAAFLEDPYQHYRELRERDPIHRFVAGSGWVLSRHREVEQALRDPELSADDRNWIQYDRYHAGGRRDDLYQWDQTLLRRDPPDNRRLRGLLNGSFTPKSLEQMRPRIEAIAQELMEPLEARGEFDLIRDFTSPLTLTVIAEILGIPTKCLEQLRCWSEDAVRSMGNTSAQENIIASDAMKAIAQYLSKIAGQRQRNPRPDMLSCLAAAQESGELTWDELEMAGMLVLVAGHETTRNLIATGTLCLLRYPDQMALLRRDPDRIPNAVEELLRFESPIQMTSRIVMEERDLGGHRLRRGEQLILLIGAANRDPEVFPDPDRLDVTRDATRQIAFGGGIHFCLGAQLARISAEAAFRALLARFPTIELSTDRVEWRNNIMLRGLTALPLRCN